MDPHRKRREDYLQRSADGATLLIAPPPARRSGDVDYLYRPDSDLYYLTGFPEPETALLLLPGDPARFLLFVRPRDPRREVWDGPRAGLDGATSDYGADESHPITELESVVLKELERYDRLYFGFGKHPEYERRLGDWMERFRARRRGGHGGPHTVSDAAEPLHEMRLRKDEAELRTLRSAAEITALGHLAGMRTARPGIHEYTVAAALEQQFSAHGAACGYPSIVASGPNATVLHSISNRRQMRDGELVLIDAAAELECLTADVTRTFPVSGRFTPAQRRLYDVVLAAEEAAISAAAPGASFDAPHQAALRVLVSGMVNLGLLTGDVDAHVAGEAFRRYYMHRTSHWLGMDVHDVGRYKVDGAWRTLEPGMVLTIEPGIYVPQDDLDAPAEYRGVGIRIEDDLLITATGREVLTTASPKEPIDVERACQAG